jgi:hypothetical protein
VTAKLNVSEKMCIFTYFTGKQNLTFFFGTWRKISVPNGTFNAEFKYVSSFFSLEKSIIKKNPLYKNCG